MTKITKIIWTNRHHEAFILHCYVKRSYVFLRWLVLLPGFDRHLLGLYLIAKEEGLPNPDLYNDPLYTKRFAKTRMSTLACYKILWNN